MTLVFTVYGVPLSKGNMRAFTPRGMRFPIITETNRNVRSWQQLVAEAASHAMQAAPDGESRQFVGCGVRVTIGFALPRPKKYQRRGVDPAHLVRPDLDRLLRAILDALSGLAYQDDQQVVELVAAKHYADIGEAPHVHVRVERALGVRPIVVPAAPLPLFEEASR